MGKVAENVVMLFAVLAAQAWFAACSFAALRAVQLTGVDGQSLAGRGAYVIAGAAGVGFAGWTMWRLMRRRVKL